MSAAAGSLWITVAISIFLLTAMSIIGSCQRYESCMREIKKVEACGEP